LQPNLVTSCQGRMHHGCYQEHGNERFPHKDQILVNISLQRNEKKPHNPTYLYM
jgi:hypothetical protein